MQHRPDTSPLRDLLVAFLVLTALAAAVYGGLWALDFGGVPGAPGPAALLLSEGAVDTFAGFGEVTVAVLGIAITVVSIILELAANRYTPRITELFLRDTVNVVVMAFFVVTATLVLWTSMSLYADHHPRAMIAFTLGAMTVSLLLLLPYFAYVFDFLTPTHIIHRIELASIAAMESPRQVGPARAEVLRGVEQLGDIALHSVEQKDKAISIATVRALADLAVASVERKPRLPDSWFGTEGLVESDQDFVALHPEMVRALGERRTWVEMKVLRQFQGIFGEALNEMRDVDHLVAIHSRRIATRALELDDRHTLALCVRFLNTFLRASINARDVRTAYNVSNEYRALAEALVDVGDDELVVEMASKMKYYGQLGFTANIGFVLETAAYDLCALIEHAHARGVACHDRLLAIFLDVDREPDEDGGQEAALRGVRKAQVKLATWYLEHDEVDRARRIWDDMRQEKPSRLRSIRDELSAILEAEYWEVSDRGINFDFLPEHRRRHLNTFFGWFDQLGAGPADLRG